MNQARPLRLQMKGVSLLELMIALSVAAILTVIAMPNLRTYVLNSHRDSTIDGLIASLNYARNQALDLDQTTYLCAGTGGVGSSGGCASGSSWDNGWDVLATPTGSTTAQVIATHALSDTGTTPSITATYGSTSFQFNGNGTVVMTMTTSGEIQEILTVCDLRGASMARAVAVNTAGFIQSSSTPGQAPSGAPLVCPD